MEWESPRLRKRKRTNNKEKKLKARLENTMGANNIK